MIIPIQLATKRGSEEACLIQLEGCIIGILVRVVPTSDYPAEEGWWLENGFGPWHQEGLLFPTLEAAANWADSRLQPGWSPNQGPGVEPPAMGIVRPQ